MPLMTIDHEKCTYDGMCADACPYGLLTRHENNPPELLKNAEEFCLSCGHCISICPNNAITLAQTAPEALTPVNRALKIPVESTEQFLRSRRSIRNYKSRVVPRETLARLVETTRWAPTAVNSQPVHWIVIEDPQEVQHLAGLTAQGLRQSSSLPAVVQAWDQGKDMILRGAPHLVVAHAEGADHAGDCVIALTYLELAAHAHGIGTCWAGMLAIVANDYSPLFEALKLPPGHMLGGAMMLGYPKYRYRRLPLRNQARIEWRSGGSL